MAKGARVWITRTQPGADATAARLTALGYEPVVRPLLRVQPIPNAMSKAPDAADIACIALTSPNGVDVIAPDAGPYLGVPVYAVGDTTADAARAAGFTRVKSASGDIHTLARLIASDSPQGTVFAPGAEQPAGDLPALLPDRSVLRLPVYATVETGELIPADTDIALLHSPRASRILAQQLAISPRTLTLIAISQAAAEPFSRLSGLTIHIADHPDEEALLRTLGNSTRGV